MRIHEGQPVLRSGVPLADALAVMILLHGRGASAADILGLGEHIAARVPGVALLAPEAANNAWYPQRFLVPLAQNEPHLTSALGVIAELIDEVMARGIAREQIVLIGFSQGACLALEFASRHARRYGAVIGLSGGLIGPPHTPRDLTGSLAGTPVYLGCGDWDTHIPTPAVEEAAEVFQQLGAAVQKAIFPGMGHTVNDEEMNTVENLVRTVATSPR